MSVDPFSDILTFASARSVVSGDLAAGGDWAVRFPPPDKIKFFAIVKGHCWLSMDGRDVPLRIEAGDVFVLTQRTIVLASEPGIQPLDGTALYADKPKKSATLGSGEDFFLLGGHIVLDPQAASFLGDVLPPLILVPATSPHAPVSTWLLNRMVDEHFAAQPGYALAMEQLGQLLFVEVLRAHFTTDVPAAGMLRAVSDKRLAPALRLIHDDPGRSWGLDELAAAAGMSRTTFAGTFKSIAGVTPIAYVTEWRMRLAQRALRDRDISVAELAYTLGYTSESAFSNAFKRITGQAPTAYRYEVRKTSIATEAA